MLARMLACAFALSGHAAVAGTYTIAAAPEGNDANPGTEAKPWATLQHAARQVKPGDIVQVRAGDYTGGYFTTSGTPDAPIVLRAYPGERPRIVRDNPRTPDGINLEGASWMMVEGFAVSGRTRAGLRAVECRHVTLRDNVLDGNGTWGILTGFCDDLLIERNIATNSRRQHGIYVSNSGDRPVLRGNVMAGNNQAGLHVNGDAEAQPGDGIISGAVIEDNFIVGNGAEGGSGINLDGVQDSVIRRNVVYDARASGISLYRIDGGGVSSGNRVLDNAVIVSPSGRWALNIQDGSFGNSVSGNVLINLRRGRGAIDLCRACLTDFRSDRNVVTNLFSLDGEALTLAGWRERTGLDAASTAASD